MSTVITAAGETLIAQKHSSGEALVIDRIILANIPGLDVSLPVDQEQEKPSANKIVYDYVIPQDYKGFVNPNQVVYSMLIGSEVGNFQFNWLGLFSSAENALVAVTHLPVTEKWQTDKGSNTLGNNLTRNFLLQFSGAKAVTNITVEAKTWQVDFTARLRSIDDRERFSNRDIYGRSCFFNDGFKLVKESGKYKLKAGVGYVEGLHCVLKSDLQIAVSALPKNVFIDVSLQQQGSNVVPVIVPKLGSTWEDYTDGNNERHYCIKIAEISAAGVIKDVRRTESVTSDLVEYLKRRTDSHANRKDDPHNTLAKVRALFSSSTTNASSSSIATPLAIKTVNDRLNVHKSANDPHGVVAKVKALLTSSITSTSTATFATPKAVKTVNDSLNAHKSSNDPHGVVAKVKALLSNSVASSSTTTFATPKAVKAVNDSLSAHKAGNDPHGVVAKVRALLTSSVTSTSTTTFATPRAVKTVRDLIVGHTNDTSVHSEGVHGGCIWFDGAVNSAGHPLDAKTGQPDLRYGVCDGRIYTAPDGRRVSTINARDRFIIAAGGKYSVGNTGGAERVSLSSHQNAKHYHLSPYTNDTHSFSSILKMGTIGSNGGGDAGFRDLTTDGKQGKATDEEYVYRTLYSGSSHSHENRPPYLGLFLIKRL